MSPPPFGIAALGLVTPLGADKATVARNLAAGTRAGLIPDADIIPGRSVFVGAAAGDYPATGADGVARNSHMMASALAQIRPEIDAAAARYGADRVAVILGTSTSGIAEGEAAFAHFRKTGAWPVGFHYRQQELGALATDAARELGLSGPAYTVATACSSSAKVFTTARRMLNQGLCDVAVVGGADSLCGTTLNGFGSLEALSKDHTNPFSRNRDGINIGEAAVAFLLTREAAPVQLLGIGESSDAHHLSAPDPTGNGARAAIHAALADAGLTADDIAYVNLHGTGTTLNDAMEGLAVADIFGTQTPCSSTKGMTGHTLGAAGACEAAFLWLTLHPDFSTGMLPPHVWDNQADPAIPPLNLVGPGEKLPAETQIAMLSNSFAFGGNNVALVLGRGFA